jgi:hypothetical protein
MGIEMCAMKRFLSLFATLLFIIPAISLADAQAGDPDESTVATDLPVEDIPDPAEETTKFKLLKKMPKNLLLVPIPMSSPTFGTGLILGGAYFYSQTEEQKNAQPASYTGAAAGYTSNNSWFAGVLQQNYWKEDTWRFNGVAGYLDLKLNLNPPATEDDETSPVDWLVNGSLFQARISRKLWGDWYLGLSARYLDISQAIDLLVEDEGFNIESDISALGVGVHLDYDSRDLPSNAYQGRYFELKAIGSHQSNSEDDSYQSYHARFRSYHTLRDSLVLAWEINGCARSGQIPLWDTCRLGLRGFPATDYLGKKSVFAQAEVRWRFYKKWGMVGFAGAGRMNDTFGKYGENETIPSYGVGIRFMVLESQRINVRVDYARSDKGNEAWYLSVTEAF